MQPLSCHKIGPYSARTGDEKMQATNESYVLKMNIIIILAPGKNDILQKSIAASCAVDNLKEGSWVNQVS